VLVYKAWELDPYKMYPKNKDKFPENFQIEVKYKVIKNKELYLD